MFDGTPTNRTGANRTAADRTAQLTTVGRLGDRVWRAHDPVGGDCVVTLLEPEALVRRRRALRKLGHPGIQRELGLVDVSGHGPALLTSFLPGVSLSEVDGTQRFDSPRRVAHIGLELLDILAHAHEHGVVHGRIARRHVIVGECIGLVGFGSAPAQASPEGDLRAVAELLYELLTGEPFTAWAAPPSHIRPELGTAFDEWLDTLADPKRCFEGAQEAKCLLRVVRATLPPVAAA